MEPGTQIKVGEGLLLSCMSVQVCVSVCVCVFLSVVEVSELRCMLSVLLWCVCVNVGDSL